MAMEKDDNAFINEESESGLKLDFDYDRLDFQEPTLSAIQSQNQVSALVLRNLMAKIKCATCTSSVSNIINNENNGGRKIQIPNEASSEDSSMFTKKNFATIVDQLLFKVNRMIPVLCAEKKLKELIVSGKDVIFTL